MTSGLALAASPRPCVHAEAGTGGSTPSAARVVLSAEHPLVAESLGLALDRRGLDVTVLGWPGGDGEPSPSSSAPVASDRAGVGVIVAELASEAELVGIRELVDLTPGRWLLLAHRGPNPLWGAVLDLPVDAVVPSSTSLDALVELIARAARGDRLMNERRTAMLRATWRDVLALDTVRDRVRSLSARETQVLHLLYAGTGVAGIAEALDVSDATVRTHVAGVLRKLGVASQLRAVAVYAEYLDRTGWVAQ